MLRLLLLPLAVMMMFVSLPAEAGPFRVFGPWHYPQGETRVKVSETFVAPRAEATYSVRLFSDSGQFQPLSKVIVTINGEEIFGPRDFAKVSVLEKAVKLRANNVITIESRGHNVGLTILIVGTDEEPATITAGVDPSLTSAQARRNSRKPVTTGILWIATPFGDDTRHRFVAPSIDELLAARHTLQ